MRKRLTLFLAAVLLLGLVGCWELPEIDDSPRAPSRMVVGIQVTCDSSLYFSRRYTEQESMNRVLKYLRELDRSSKLKGDPEKSLGTVYRFELQYADGTTKTYAQVASWYLKEGDEPWQQLVDADIQELYDLLKMPSDPG